MNKPRCGLSALTLAAALGLVCLPASAGVLYLTSVTEADSGVYVSRVTVRVFDGVNGTNKLTSTGIGSRTPFPVLANDVVEIAAPREVYRDLFEVDITDSVQGDPQQIQDDAEERFTAIGISVNDIAQTGDPTFYRFRMPSTDVEIKVKWRHEYALTVRHDFTLTQSQEKDAAGNPWAGPLTSEATGNPDPPSKKHWIKRGDTEIVRVDGQVLDFSRPGLDIRYVPKAYVASGPPNRNTTDQDDLQDRRAGLPLQEENFPWVVGQSPPSRQQVPQFTMYGPGVVSFVWQIQFGVRVNIDSPARAALPKVFAVQGSTDLEIGSGEGVFWFDPNTRVKVATAANETDTMSAALSGWQNGDGYFFSSSGEIDTSDGSLLIGGPALRTNGSPVAVWAKVMTLNPSPGVPYRGLEIPQLGRAARVLWTYGVQQLKVDTLIGEYVFQHDPQHATNFIIQPDRIEQIIVNGANQQVAAGDMAIWDPEARRLYPLVYGKFKAVWRPDPESPRTVDVIVTATFPNPAHYPHVANTPPVALDPDPEDNFAFKQLKYSENQAAVDGAKRFTAGRPGKTVLLFAEIQPDGRGVPREFLRVRVVDTIDYQTGISQADAIIGRKVSAPDLDLANLGTGYIVSFEQFTGIPDKTRYNPFIYDRTKLDGLAARDIYDLVRLRSDNAEKIVINKDKLPGPIIPVNLHPGAANTQRVVVVWYDDPTQNDELLWPHRARYYTARWPVNAAEGLGRITIASQFGSESRVVESGQEIDQEVVPPIGNFPGETTYNPARIQQVQIYSQPDTNSPGYNPNEEHGVIAPSLRFAQVSPRPPAVYALRDNDLNVYEKASPTELSQPAGYTSHPCVLVQFFDTADSEFKMRIYRVFKEDTAIAGYRFAAPNKLLSSTDPRLLQAEPHVLMEAGEPVIPFYPLVQVIGASPCAQSFGINLKGQTVYWEDHKGSSWAVSGGTNAWFTVSTHYPLQTDFWWPNKPGFIFEELDANNAVVKKAGLAQAGDCVSFLPQNVDSLLALAAGATVTSAIEESNKPTRILYKSDWPKVAAVLKAGETMTFQGGEFRADHPISQIVDDNGDLQNVETPGLPGIVGFASAEVVFDSLNPLAQIGGWTNTWTARVGQVLEQRSVPLSLADFPPDLQPATKRTRVKQGKYVFNELPASLQKRVRFDPLLGRLEIVGLLNDKEIGNDTLTAAPPAVYVLEPNIMTAEEKAKLRALSENSEWTTAVDQLAKLSRNPSVIDTSASLPDEPQPGSSDYLTKLGEYRAALQSFWETYYRSLGDLSATDPVPLPIGISEADDAYLVGLQPKILRDGSEEIITIEDPLNPGLQRVVSDPKQGVPLRGFGPGLALLPNPNFLDLDGSLPEISWVTVVENNDPTLGGSPITLHVIKVDQRERYRGAIKTITSDNVFDENLVLRHTGDFGANADDLFFEWWYRPDDGSLNVPPPDLLQPGQSNPWKLFPDDTGNRGRGRFQVLLKGNPNAPETLLADSWWFVRYRHRNDETEGANWNVNQRDANGIVVAPKVNFTWAGAGNSDPFNDFDLDGIPDYRAQLAQGWIKRVLDAVNPYEARIRDFEGDNPTTRSSMLSQFGVRFEGPVALNPDKNVIENVGLIELYETILRRGRELSIDLTRPVSTPAIANALQLASTRISDFYTILGNEAYVDGLDPTIGIGTDNVEYGSLAPAVFAFQNQMSSLIEEELGLLRGLDDFFARPVYNRLFWNFTKAEGEAAYAINYNITDINQDAFIDEDDAMILYPQGHGDSWGHYLTALRNQYELLNHKNFNWVSRSEFYNLMDIVIKVDFLDERKFAQTAAAKAKAGAEIVNLTYRQKYVEDPTAQWQGYTDSNNDRAWGVQEWSRRAAQGAYFDWITANALLPSEHPNQNLEGIQKVDRRENADIPVISANLNAVQATFDQANKGENPLGVAPNAVPFDINPILVEDLSIYGKTHFEQIYERALRALDAATVIWNNANEDRNRIRQIANDEAEFRNSVFQEDLSYRNQLIKIFGTPYEGTIGSGKIYPPGYDGPDLLLFMYVDVRQIDNRTVPGPTKSFAQFDTNGVLMAGNANVEGIGDIYDAFYNGRGGTSISTIDNSTRLLFSPTFAQNGTNPIPASIRDGWYSVRYTDLTSPKVGLDRLTQVMPITAAGYTFQAPRDWGRRRAVGELQLLISQMIQQEAQISSAIGAWDALSGQIGRTMRLANAKIQTSDTIQNRTEAFIISKNVIHTVITGIATAIEIFEATRDTVTATFEGSAKMVPTVLPTGGLAVSPGDALAPVRGALTTASVATTSGIGVAETLARIAKLIEELALEIAADQVQLANDKDERSLAKKELLKEIEDLLGDEPIRRIEIFKEIENLRELSDQYRAMLTEGIRLIDERAAFNKRVAAQTQRNRYQDMTFRVSRNHALQHYRSMFDLAAKYTYLAAKAYDYETNFDPRDPGAPTAILSDIVRARTLGRYEPGEVAEPGVPHLTHGGLAAALAWLKINYASEKTQLGMSNPQNESGKISLRTECYRILPSGSTQPEDEPTIPFAGEDSDALWRQTLEEARVDDLWMVPEFRYYCRPFAAEADANGNHVEEPGLVLRFQTKVMSGENFFGRPLMGADHAFDPSHYSTRIRSVGLWFSDYLSGDLLNELPAAPRAYLIPIGLDVMSVPTSDNPSLVRLWKVVDQRIPVPLPATTADLDRSNWVPLLDGLNGRLGEPRTFSMLRAYHDGSSDVNFDELVPDSRLIGRSIWNTQWLLIIPGRVLNNDPQVGLERFIDQITDIKLVFQTYGYSGN